jgi:hypothetical protein
MASSDAKQSELAKKYIVCEGEPYKPDTVKVNGSVYIREDLTEVYNEIRECK